MAFPIKDLLASDAWETFIRKLNFNFDLIAQQGGGVQGLQGIQGIMGSQGIPGNDGSFWFVVNDLNTFFASNPSVTDNDLILVLSDHTYSSILYKKGDILRLNIVGTNITLTLLGNLKPDNIITPSTSNGVLETIFNGSQQVYHRNVTESSRIPLILSTRDTVSINDVLDKLQQHILTASNNAATYIYGSDSNGGGGRLSFLYGDGVNVDPNEIINAPYIKGVINNDQFSMLMASFHNFLINFNDDFRIGDGINNFFTIDQSRNFFHLLNSGSTFNVWDGTNYRLFIGSTGLVGINTNIPTQQLDVNGNINVRGYIANGNSPNQLYFSTNGFLGIGTNTTPFLVNIDNPTNNTVKFNAQNSIIEGANNTDNVDRDFIIRAGEYVNNGTSSTNAPHLVLRGGLGNTSTVFGQGSRGGNIYIVGGDGNNKGDVLLGVDNDGINRGNVGVGVTNPRSNFEVLNNIVLSSSTGLVTIKSLVPIGQTTTNASSADILITTDNVLGAGLSAGDITIRGGQAGFSGLGGNIFIETSNVNADIILKTISSSSSVILQADENGTPTDGTVSIGTNSNLEKLVVNGNSLMFNSFGDVYNRIQVSGSNSGRIRFEDNSDYLLDIGVDESTNINFVNSNNGRKLLFSSSNTSDHIFEFSNQANTVDNIIKIDAPNATNSVLDYIDFSANSISTGSIRKSNNTTVYLTSSDERLKKDISDFNDNAMDIINKIRIRNYKWKSNNEDAYGFIAQELEKVLPKSVFSNANGYKQVDYQSIIPILVKSIQELYKKLES